MTEADMQGGTEAGAARSGGPEVHAAPIVPATVTTARALLDEAEALDRVEALSGTATMVHEDVPADGRPVTERLHEQAVALGRVDELHRDPDPLPPPLVHLHVAIRGDLLRLVSELAERTGRSVDDLCAAGLEMVLRDAAPAGGDVPRGRTPLADREEAPGL